MGLKPDDDLAGLPSRSASLSIPLKGVAYPGRVTKCLGNTGGWHHRHGLDDGRSTRSPGAKRTAPPGRLRPPGQLFGAHVPAAQQREPLPFKFYAVLETT